MEQSWLAVSQHSDGVDVAEAHSFNLSTTVTMSPAHTPKVAPS
jgi:hypothetical protein